MKKRNKGFTLVELMVVMGIVAVLAMVGGAAYISAQKRGRNARRAADIQQIRSALEMYRSDNSYYPNRGNTCDSSIGLSGGCPAGGANWDFSSAGLAKTLVDGGYMTSSNFPKDPMNTTTMFYRYESLMANGTSCNSNCPRYRLSWQEELMSGSLDPKEVFNP